MCNLNTFASIFGDCTRIRRVQFEGIRCESGAVPAAVSSIKKFESTFATVLLLTDGKAFQTRASQKTCQDHFLSFCFRVRSGCREQLIFVQHLSIIS